MTASESAARPAPCPLERLRPGWARGAGAACGASGRSAARHDRDFRVRVTQPECYRFTLLRWVRFSSRFDLSLRAAVPAGPGPDAMRRKYQSGPGRDSEPSNHSASPEEDEHVSMSAIIFFLRVVAALIQEHSERASIQLAQRVAAAKIMQAIGQIFVIFCHLS